MVVQTAIVATVKKETTRSFTIDTASHGDCGVRACRSYPANDRQWENFSIAKFSLIIFLSFFSKSYLISVGTQYNCDSCEGVTSVRV